LFDDQNLYQMAKIVSVEGMLYKYWMEKLNSRVQLPITKEVYLPILKELEDYMLF
jgi:hypothetical protein